MRILNFNAIAIGLTLMFAALVGCDTQTTNLESKPDKSADSQPNLSLHKPKELSSAIVRLRDIHDSLTTGDSFPAPTKIDYVEVYHGDESSGHSHYYLAADYDESGGTDEHDGFPGEEVEMEEKVSRRVFELDLRTELTDVVGWLPSIAAKSSISEAEWEQVSSVSKELTAVIESIAADSSDDDFQKAWKQQATAIETQLNKLPSVAAADGAGDEASDAAANGAAK